MKSLLLLLLSVTAALGGEHVHRVTGLFAPDREADLRRALEEIPGIQLVSLDFDHAEATLAYDEAAIFPKLRPEQIAESLDQKLRAASRATLGIQPLCPTPRERLQRIEIPIAGLDCRACCLAAYESVFKIEGVAQATASFREGRLTALIDPARTDRAALEAALAKRNVKVKSPAAP